MITQLLPGGKTKVLLLEATSILFDIKKVGLGGTVTMQEIDPDVFIGVHMSDKSYETCIRK